MIRAATAADAAECAKLVFNSGRDSLLTLFGCNQARLLDYLQQSLSQPHGQFGYANHSLAIVEGNLAGVISAWHQSLPENFQKHTIQSISTFFGVEKSLQIIDRSLLLSAMLPPPQANEYCIGHLAVTKRFHRRGIASALLEKMLQNAKQLELGYAVLDMQVNNANARAFYQKLGFNVVARLQSASARQVGFPEHVRLQKKI